MFAHFLVTKKGPRHYARKINSRVNTKNHINVLFSGAVLSLVLFKRKSWPMVFGLGSGFGMAYTNCEQEINKK